MIRDMSNTPNTNTNIDQFLREMGIANAKRREQIADLVAEMPTEWRGRLTFALVMSLTCKAPADRLKYKGLAEAIVAAVK